MAKKRYFIETFGCQMNVNDSERVAGLLQAAQLEPSQGPEDADFVFVNTCAVRENASEKLYHQLGRWKKLKAKRPGLKIGVGGCEAQLQGKKVLERAPYVDVLVGTRALAGIGGLLERALVEAGPQVDLERRTDVLEGDHAVAHTSQVRAFVTVIEGCNHVCSFCVVPRTRGPELNRPPDEVVREVRALVARGYREVMLLGQTVDAYRSGETDFAGLLGRVDAVAGLERTRFTTSHPAHVTPALAEALRTLPTVCPYMHLPVQSGSDRILASMRRGYDRARYLDTVALLRDRVRDLAISSDVIVGYPGETQADFEETMRLVDDVGYESLFVFMYSPRPGTTARLLTDDVAPAEKLRRMQAINGLQQERQRAENLRRIGGREQVLVDALDAARGRVSGRSRHFRLVHLDGGAELLGQIVDVEITGAGANSLSGRRSPEVIH